MLLSAIFCYFGVVGHTKFLHIFFFFNYNPPPTTPECTPTRTTPLPSPPPHDVSHLAPHRNPPSVHHPTPRHSSTIRHPWVRPVQHARSPFVVPVSDVRAVPRCNSMCLVADRESVPTEGAGDGVCFVDSVQRSGVLLLSRPTV